MNELISVIVPVYNVEQYLSQCINSILNQSYGDLEVILIDDGSTDNSGQICDTYSEKDSRVKVIHQKNGGAANAKNTGLRIANGRYLAFVDSDDYLEHDAYAYMVSKMIEYQADVIQCSFRNVFVDQQTDVIKISEFTELNTKEYLQQYTIDWTCGLLWDKLYRRELFDGIFFEEGHKIDDEFFTYQGIMNAKKIIRASQIVYNYRMRQSGVMLSESSQKQILMDKLEYMAKRRENVVKKFPELKQEFDYHFLNMLVILSSDSSITEVSIKEIKRLLKNYDKESTKCKMELTLKQQIFRLKYSKVESILKRRKRTVINQNQFQYFE